MRHSDDAPRRRRSPRAALVALALALSGCGEDGPPVPLFPASGQVLFDDQPAAGVEVRLFDAGHPTDAGAFHPYATTDAEGRFRLGTFRDGDGAPEGRYAVMLLWPDGPRGAGVPKDRFANAFTNPAASPFRVEVARGETRLEPFRIDAALVKKTAPKAAAPRGAANPDER